MKTVTSDSIAIIRPPLEEFLGNYNNFMAGFLSDERPYITNLLSSVFNRLEAQTHFFERLQYFKQFHHFLIENPNIILELIPDHDYLYPALNHEFHSRVTTNSKLNHGIIGKIKSICCFACRSFVNLKYHFAVSLYCFSFLRPTPKSVYIRTWFDYRNVADNGINDEYFGKLVNEIDDRKSLGVVYRLLNTNRHEFTDYLKARKKASFLSYPWESYISPIGVVRAFLRFLLYGRIKLSRKVVYEGLDITNLLQGMINYAFSHFHGLEVSYEYEVAKTILKTNPERIIYPFENQTWEKIYPYLRDALQKKTILVGFQHSGFSYKILNHFPCLNDSEQSLFPDKIVTVGELLTQWLGDNAHYPCPLVTGAALRFQNHFTKNRIEVSKPDLNLHKAIAFAFSYDLNNYRRIYSVLNAIFGNTEINVYMKYHPIHRNFELVKELIDESPPNFINSINTPWSQIFPQIDLILYDDNSLAVEGMIYGLKTYYLNTADPIYHCDRLYNFSEWQPTVDENILADMQNELVQGTYDKSFSHETIENYVNSYYHPYSPIHTPEAFLS